MEIQSYACKAVQHVQDQLVRNLEAMPEDKARWKPLDNGRKALELAMECAIGFRMIATSLNDKAPMHYDKAAAEKFVQENETKIAVVSFLKESSGHLIKAIEEFPAESLDELTSTLMGETLSYGDLMLDSTSNAIYHLGQIGYIQTLYGDWERH